jgi:C4-dicarboxylate transporter, DctM subunit
MSDERPVAEGKAKGGAAQDARTVAGWNPLARVLNILGSLGSMFFVCVAFMVVFEITARFVFRSPTSWIGEMTSWVTIAASFLLFAYTLKEKGHTRVDFITAYLSKASDYLLELFTTCLGIVFTLVLTWYGMKMVVASYSMGETSQVLQAPLWILQAFVPFGCFLMLLQLLKVLIDMTKGLFRGVLSSFPGGVKPQSFIATAVFLGGLILCLALIPYYPKVGLCLLFFALLFNGMPVSFAMALFGIFGFFVLLGGSSVIQAPMIAYNTIDSIVIVAFPLFLLSGTILEAGNIGPRIFHFANTLVRHLPGGMGIASIIFCGIFAAMTGSSVAVAAAVSVIALPEMLKRGYSRTVSIGLLAAGGTLGILFPPSIALIMYSALTFESLGQLFLGALIPGLILTFFFCAYMFVVGLRDQNIKRDKRASLSEIWQATGESIGGLIVIFIIMGGIYSGLFTPTEAGAVAVLYSIFLTTVWYKTLTLRELAKCVLKAGKMSSMIILIIVAANITGNLVTMSQMTQDLLALVQSMSLPSWLYIVFILVLLIVLGGPLEAVSIMVITVPILYPVIKALGFNGIWFGIIQVVTGELALISPPEGINLFILQEVGKSTAAEVSRGVVPFLILMAIFLALISIFPGLVSWLPAVLK